MIFFGIIAACIVATVIWAMPYSHIEYMPYKDFRNEVINGNIDEASIIKDKLNFELNGSRYYTYNPNTDTLKDELVMNGVRLTSSASGTDWAELISTIITAVVTFMLVAVLLFKLFPNLKSKNRVEIVNDTKVTFQDVIGMDGLKKELFMIIDIMKNENAYEKIDVRAPKGILLEGEPGNGKTLLARAFAKEAGINFIQKNASDFGGFLRGKGVLDIKSLFKEARKNAPCAIFIDEFDSIGGKRSTSEITGDQDDVNTLNMLLSELDGFKKNKGIIVIAATNRSEVLDTALMRPGRFDKKYVVKEPGYEDRKNLIKLFLKNKKVCDDIDIADLAYKFSGFSCAKIESILNEAAINSIFLKKEALNETDINHAIIKDITRGNVTKNTYDEDDLKIVAYHEAAHAIEGFCQLNKVIDMISVLPTTSGVGGITMQYRKCEPVFTRIGDMKKEIKVLLAGRAAEYILGNSSEDMVTSGSLNDLQRAVELAEQIILLSKEGMVYNLKHGENMEDKKLYTVKILLENLWEETVTDIKTKWQCVEKIAFELMKKNVISKKQFEKIMENSQQALAG